MDEFIKKEEKTYVIQADSEKELSSENSKEAIDIEDENIDEQNDLRQPPKKIEVVPGNGKSLDISDVSEYLEVEKPREDRKKGNIIIPEEKKDNNE